MVLTESRARHHRSTSHVIGCVLSVPLYILLQVLIKKFPVFFPKNKYNSPEVFLLSLGEIRKKQWFKMN